jgi:gamma-glutamylputrescine oxidase
MLDGVLDLDVCVVGAGIAGCSAALYLSERGYRVAVLETARVGHGASIRSDGQLIGHDVFNTQGVRRQIAQTDMRRMWQILLGSVAITTTLIAKHRIACDFVGGQLIAAIKPRQHRQLCAFKSELEETCGYPHLLLIEKDYLDEFVPTPRYVSGLYDARGGHVHPLNFALGLAAAAQSAGAQFYEATPALHLDPSTPIRIRTPKGMIRCQYVLLCGATGLGGLPFDPWRKTLPIGVCTTATEPLGEARARDILPSNAAVTDLNFMRDYFRLSADWRLLFGGWIGNLPLSPPRLAAILRRRMLRVFPQLHDVRQEYTWGDMVNLTMNHVPQFGRLHPKVYFTHGYTGHGVALAVLGGQLLAEAMTGTVERFDLFAKIPHRDFPGGRLLRGPLRALVMMYCRLRDSL